MDMKMQKEVRTMTDNKVVRLEQSLESMCRRCVNYEMCQGTGCEPLKMLKSFIIEQDLIDDVMDE